MQILRKRRGKMHSLLFSCIQFSSKSTHVNSSSVCGGRMWRRVCVCESHSFISFASVAALDFSVLSHILFLFFSIRLLCVLVDGSKNLKCRQKAPKHDCRKTLCKAVNKRSKDKSAHFCTQFVLTWQLKWKKIFYDFWNDGIFE